MVEISLGSGTKKQKQKNKKHLFGLDTKSTWLDLGKKIYLGWFRYKTTWLG